MTLKLKVTKSLFSRKLLIVAVVLLAVFMLSNGLGASQIYRVGAHSASDARFAVTAPFFFGFVLIGFFGLLSAYKNAGKIECLYGFGIVGFCYFGIEVIYQLCGGM